MPGGEVERDERGAALVGRGVALHLRERGGAGPERVVLLVDLQAEDEEGVGVGGKLFHHRGRAVAEIPVERCGMTGDALDDAIEVRERKGRLVRAGRRAVCGGGLRERGEIRAAAQ